MTLGRLPSTVPPGLWASRLLSAYAEDLEEASAEPGSRDLWALTGPTITLTPNAVGDLIVFSASAEARVSVSGPTVYPEVEVTQTVPGGGGLTQGSSLTALKQANGYRGFSGTSYGPVYTGPVSPTGGGPSVGEKNTVMAVRAASTDLVYIRFGIWLQGSAGQIGYVRNARVWAGIVS